MGQSCTMVFRLAARFSARATQEFRRLLATRIRSSSLETFLAIVEGVGMRSTVYFLYFASPQDGESP